MNIHLGVFVIPNQQSRVEVNDVNTVRDAGLVVPATRSEATPPPTPAAHDSTTPMPVEPLVLQEGRMVVAVLRLGLRNLHYVFRERETNTQAV